MHRSRFLGHQPLLSRLVCRCHLLSSPQTPLKSLLAHARVAFSWPRVRLAPLTASSRRDVRPSLDRLLVSLDLGPRSPPPRAKNRISSSRRRQKMTARVACVCARAQSLRVTSSASSGGTPICCDNQIHVFSSPRRDLTGNHDLRGGVLDVMALVYDLLLLGA